MSRRLVITLLVIVAVAAFCVAALLTGIGGREGLVLGLDLRGGTNLVYQADFTDIEEGRESESLRGAKDIIERRIDAYGVSESVVQIVGSNRIMVQLPGVTDIEEAKDLVGKTAELIFRERAAAGSTVLAEPVSAGDTNVTVMDAGGFAAGDVFVVGSANSTESESRIAEEVLGANNTMVVNRPFDYDHTAGEPVNNAWTVSIGTIEGEEIPLTGKHLKPNSYVGVDQTTGEPVVHFEWDETGAKLFSQVTGRLVGEPLAIFLDETLISAPTVQSQIGAQGIIEGLTIDEAEILAIQLNAGALPVPLEPIQEQTVDATLGADSLRLSMIAGIVGVVLLLLFMMIYYRLAGGLACLALAIYAAAILMIFKMVPVTLTLAGIAAFILSLGLAVDANVLIFERMKEELRAGRALRPAIEVGFNRAWPAIRDSNISTLIICAILYWFGSRMFGGAQVMGFAATLGIGVLVSMVTAIVVTRNFLRITALSALGKRSSLFRP
ncbi:MAG: protein translocase subunit SecD [Chloroflexota bacterium]